MGFGVHRAAVLQYGRGPGDDPQQVRVVVIHNGDHAVAHVFKGLELFFGEAVGIGAVGDDPRCGVLPDAFDAGELALGHPEYRPGRPGGLN